MAGDMKFTKAQILHMNKMQAERMGELRLEAIALTEKLDADRKFLQDRAHDYCVRMEAAESQVAALQERIRHLESVNALPCGPDQVAALTASLASVTSEVERLKSEKDYDGKEVLAAELAELRKRMEAAERVVDMMYDRWDNGDDCYEDPREFVGHLGKACQFSDEELNAIEEVLSLREGDEAPVESKPKEGA